MFGEEHIAPDSVPAPRTGFKSIDVVRTLHKFGPAGDTTLAFKQGETVHVLAKGSNGWWDGIVEKGDGEYARGWFPSSYVRSITGGPVFAKMSKGNLADSLYSGHSGSYPSSRRNSAASVDSSLNEQDRASVSTVPDQQQQQQQALAAAAHQAPGTEITILTAEDVEKLCASVLAQTNEPAVWVPQLTDDGDLVYYSERFDAYARELPLTAAPKIDADSLLKFPKRSTLNRLETVGLPREDESAEKLNYRQVRRDGPFGGDGDGNGNGDGSGEAPAAVSASASASASSAAPAAPAHVPAAARTSRDPEKMSQASLPASTDTVHAWNNSLFSDDALFYTDPSDMKTWGQLYKTFVFLLDLCADALAKSQTAMFSSHYNNVTKICTLFQLSARLVQHELVQQNLDYVVQSKLKKMTNSVAQLGINGDLHLSVQPGVDYPYDDGQSVSSGDTPSVNTAVYLDKVKGDIKALKARAEAVFVIFSAIKYDDPGHDATLLPQIYPRFLKDAFDGGNWVNPLFEKKANPFRHRSTAELQFGPNKRARFFQDRANRPRILLDKDAMGTLEGKKAKLTRTLADLLSALDMPVPETTDLSRFKDERNITVLSIVYNVLQPASRILDILESFDFSVFKAAKQMPFYNDGEGKAGADGTGTTDADPAANSAFFDTDVVSYTYPMLIEFFDFKQELYDSFTQLILDAQGLTVEDPEVFKGIREDDVVDYNKAASELPTEKLAAKLKTLLIENDINNDFYARLQFNKDGKLRDSIEKLSKSLGMVIYSVQQLINERESILNYSSRNMNAELDLSLYLGERHGTIPDLMDDYRPDEFSNPRRLSRDVPWYLDIDDSEYSIIYDSKGNIKGGSIDGLIAHLTSNAEKDPDFISAFLLTFRSFISPLDLVRELEARYHLTPPEGLSFEEYNTWRDKKLTVVRTNVMSVIWLLLTRYWNVFYYDQKLMAAIADFVERASPAVVPNKEDYFGKIKQLGDLNKRRTPNIVGSSFKIETLASATAPPPPILKGSSLRRLRLRDIDPHEMARQLTIREFAFYSRITEAEFLDKIWGEKYGKMGSSSNIKYFISYANKLTNFVSFMIIKHKDAKKRAETIVYFLQVCEKCLALKNYSSLTAVISALSSSPIARLKKTWAKVPGNYMETYTRLDKLMSIDRNYNEYRDLLKFVKDNEPCIPFLGIYLTDLTFVSQAISDYVNRDKDIINFYKRYKIYYTITESLKYERIAYNFQIVHEIQSFLDNWFLVSPDVNDQHKISLAIEPRVAPAAR